MKPSIDQEYIKVETEDAVLDRKIIGPEKGLTAEIALNTIEEEEIITTEVTGLIIELGVDQGMAMEIEDVTGLIIGKVTKETILGRSIVSKDTEIEV